ncbi:MAG: hypothetical protein RLZZ337_1838 [Bacteroidota bacterium]|jgi:peptidoglycan/LPS O-acetylase OafA/YrhL
MSNIVRIVYWALVIIALLYGTVYLIWGGGDDMTGSSISLIISYILFGLAFGITLIAAIGNIIQHPKDSIKLLIGIGVVALIAIIGYSVSKGEVLDSYIDFGVKTKGESKLVDLGLYMFYSLLSISIVGILVSEFTGFFKN